MQDRHSHRDPQPMEPIALTLAVWLGLIVCVTGVIHMADRAAADAVMAQNAQAIRPAIIEAAQATEAMRATQLRLIAFGN